MMKTTLKSAAKALTTKKPLTTKRPLTTIKPLTTKKPTESKPLSPYANMDAVIPGWGVQADGK